MSNVIRANRLEASDRFPIVGFTIRTSAAPAYCEIAVAANDSLFRVDQKSQRTTANFYSTRANGPIKIERGEAVYLLPPEVLSRFVGQEKLYYALATFSDPARTQAEISVMPNASSPWINIKMLTGRSLRRATTNTRNGHANGDALTWAGDAVRPGTEPAATAPTANGGAPAQTSTNDANRTMAPAAASQAYTPGFDIAYDDGFSPSLWARLQEVNEEDGGGIDEPIPDVSVVGASQGLGYSRAFSAPQYPAASRFVPAASVNYRTPNTPRTINRVVIHITDGGRAIAGPISWFQNPNQQNNRGQTIRVSAHYVVGQDGEVVQMVPHEAIAWHAGSANGDSIGIEHVANTRGLNPTQAEYAASACLVRWLCEQYGIPIDRDHILGHSEADTHTSHRACPNAVWDWDTYMAMVTSNECAPQATAQSWQEPARTTYSNGHAAMPLRQTTRRASAFSTEIIYDVPLIPQPDKLSCWAASMAMLVSYRRGESMPPERLAQEVGRSLRTSYSWDMLEAVKDQFGFREIELPSDATLYPSPEQWFGWLNDYGPVWVTVRGAPSHAIIVRGMSGDLTPEGTTMHVLNPWDTTTAFSGDPVDFVPANQGRAYSQPFEAFAAEFGLINLPLGNWRVLFLPAAAAQSASLGWQRTAYASRRARAFDETFDVGWQDTELVPQLTDKSCWAAAAAMVVGWRDRVSINPADIAAGTGYWSAYRDGLYPANHRDLAQAWGLIAEPPQSYSVEGFRRLLENNGPLWIGVAVPSGHAVVVTGMYGDGTPENTMVRINDPWPPDRGTQSEMPFTQLMQEYENRMTTDSRGNVNVQIMHAGGRAATSESQGYAPARTTNRRNNGQRSRSMAVVEIASAIAGAAMTRILDNNGDVAWELDQLRGLKHIGDNAANAGSGGYHDATPVTISGWYVENGFSDRITADFRVRFQYNGRSLGNVQIDNIGTNDAVGWGLHVRANIMDDAQTYSTVPPSDAQFAAIRVHFYYRFDRSIGGDYIAEIDLTLYGNGTHHMTGRWVQEG